MYFVKIFHFNPYTIIWMLWLSELWLHCVYIHVCVYITGVACWLDFRESLGFGITLPNLQKFYFHLIDTVLTFILILSMKAQELLVRRQWPYMCKCPRNWKLLAACLLSAHWDFFNKKYNFYIFFFFHAFLVSWCIVSFLTPKSACFFLNHWHDSKFSFCKVWKFKDKYVYINYFYTIYLSFPSLWVSFDSFKTALIITSAQIFSIFMQVTWLNAQNNYKFILFEKSIWSFLNLVLNIVCFCLSCLFNLVMGNIVTIILSQWDFSLASKLHLTWYIHLLQGM